MLQFNINPIFSNDQLYQQWQLSADFWACLLLRHRFWKVADERSLFEIIFAAVRTRFRLIFSSCTDHGHLNAELLLYSLYEQRQLFHFILFDHFCRIDTLCFHWILWIRIKSTALFAAFPNWMSTRKKGIVERSRS